LRKDGEEIVAMMRTDDEREQGSYPLSDRRLWQRCRSADIPEDEAARYLDLAAFAEGRLDPDETDRVAAWLADDPEAAADVRSARTSRTIDEDPATLERVVARAAALVPDRAAHGRVVPFVRPRGGRIVPVLAQWASLAAAIALASWLGFAMGTGTSLALSEPRSPSEAVTLPELFDPGPGFLRDLGEGLRT
jgi:anti-sigma factor RsiW